MRTRLPIIVVAVVATLTSGLLAGLLYVADRDSSQTEAALKRKLADAERKQESLTDELDRVRAAVNKAKDGNETFDEDADESGDESIDPATNQTDSVREGVRVALRNMDRDADDFDVVEIREHSGWATGQAQPRSGEGETELFVFKREGEKWKIMDYGTGLEHSDYPNSPLEIWP